jgi:hypothetical protein
MNRRRKKSLNNKKEIKQKRIIRCRSKMIPVFESDDCGDFIKKEDRESNHICKNCKHSF